jgi:hypothetical protein
MCSWEKKIFFFYLPEEVKRILLIISLVIRLLPLQRDRGLEQLISNGGKFKTAFAKRDKKHTRIDLREISSNLFKPRFCPSIRLSRLRALLIAP